MAENKLTLKITLKHYDRGFFLCPLCPYDDIRYKTEYCPQCGVKLEWDEDLDKVFVKRRNIEYGNSSINILFPSKEIKEENNMNNFPVGTKVKIISERKDFVFMYGKDNEETGVVIGNNGCEGCGITVEIDKPRLIGTYNFDTDELEVIANIKLL